MQLLGLPTIQENLIHNESNVMQGALAGEVETGEPRRCSEFGRHLVTFDCLPLCLCRHTCLTYFLKHSPWWCVLSKETLHTSTS